MPGIPQFLRRSSLYAALLLLAAVAAGCWGLKKIEKLLARDE